MAYQTKDWTAAQTTNLIGSEYNLTVTGEVQVLKTSEQPHLAEAKPPGINPIELILDLTVTGGSEIGGHVVLWKTVTFKKHVSPGEYHTVMIRQDGAPGKTIKVEQVPS
jgi:hypothetical protein